MKFSLLAPLLALAGTIVAAPAATVNSNSTPQLSIDTANNMVEALQARLLPMMQTINSTVSDFQTGKLDKTLAIQHVGAQFQSMTTAINTATAEIGSAAKSSGLHTREIEARQDNDALQRLARNLQKTLTALAGTVNAALRVLGLTPLLAFLQPLTGSLSGIVLMLITVVNPLLAVLRVLLDGVLLGVSGLLGGLIL